MREWQQAIEAACKAVRQIVGLQSCGPHCITRDDAISSIRALPAPEPVGVDKLVNGPLMDEVSTMLFDSGYADLRRCNPLARKIIRAVLAYYSREADKVREVLQEVLAAINLHEGKNGCAFVLGRFGKDSQRSRVERAAMVKP